MMVAAAATRIHKPRTRELKSNMQPKCYLLLHRLLLTHAKHAHMNPCNPTHPPFTHTSNIQPSIRLAHSSLEPPLFQVCRRLAHILQMLARSNAGILCNKLLVYHRCLVPLIQHGQVTCRSRPRCGCTPSRRPATTSASTPVSATSTTRCMHHLRWAQ
jgi:hypothetical protein